MLELQLKLESKVRSSGLRLTQARKLVLQKLLKSKIPLTIQELFEQLNKSKKTAVDTVSLYRIMKTFEEIKIVHRTDKNTYLLCQHIECDEANHLLLMCRKCRKAQEIHSPDQVFLNFSKLIQTNEKFKLDTHALQLRGLCKNCTDLRA